MLVSRSDNTIVTMVINRDSAKKVGNDYDLLYHPGLQFVFSPQCMSTYTINSINLFYESIYTVTCLCHGAVLFCYSLALPLPGE